ncbi:DUF202 domain-containing protein [Rhodococcus sp. NPDC057529]|uniref:DUF202 domain-containing protein n=1 Tax=Rhodococcus sp. NPDC057529 TaxID=3346158 RepID=UPI00366D69A5
MSAAPVAVHDDPGLQPERTTLSWIRTLIVFGADAILFARISPGPAPAVLAVGGLCLLFGVVALSTAGAQHARRVERFSAGTAPPALTANLLLTLSVLLLSGSAATFILM